MHNDIDLLKNGHIDFRDDFVCYGQLTVDYSAGSYEPSVRVAEGKVARIVPTDD